MKKLFYGVAATALVAMAPAANAAHLVNTTQSQSTLILPDGTVSITGTFRATGVPTGNFSDIFTFTTPAGLFTSTVQTIAVAFQGPGDFDFTSVFLNGTIPFANLTGPGVFELRLLPNTGVLAGMQTITVNGVSRGNGSFTGEFAFLSAASAVPEPATWAMMIGGFGMVGGAMRSARRKQKLQVSYA